MASVIRPAPIVLTWFSDADPTIAPGVKAPLYQYLIRTDVPALYWKSGAADTDWTLVGSGIAPVTEITVENEGVSIGQFDTLDFAGNGVNALDLAGVALIAIPSHPTYIPEIWAVNDLAQNQGSEVTAFCECQLSTLFDDWVPMRAGSLVGICIRLSEAITAGTLRVIVTVGGVDTDIDETMSGGSQLVSSYPVGDVPYNPGIGDTVAVRYITSNDFAPANIIDMEVTLQGVEDV